MGSGKGGQQTTTVELPPEIEQAALGNLDLAKKVGKLPYAPYFGPSVAAFTPAQNAGFRSMDKASGAFGLPGQAAGNMPKPQNFGGGMKGYSTEGMYNAAMKQVPPEILKLYQSFFAQPGGGGQGGGGGPGGGQPAGVVPQPRQSALSPSMWK